MNDVLEKVSQDRRDTERFIRSCGHDLKEPLRTVNSMLSLLKKDNYHRLDTRGNQYIDLSLDSVKQMNHLVDYLMEYIQLDSHTHTFEEIELVDCFNQAIDWLQPQIMFSQPIIDCLDRLPVVIGDVKLITKVFYNLLSNAIKFSSTPRITVSSEEYEDKTLILFKDNGIGISEVDKSSIFRPFNRIHSKRHYSGAGLGLAICRRIMEKHQGSIKVESTLGEGTEFELCFPKSFKEELLN